MYKLSNRNSTKTVVNSSVRKVKLFPAPLMTPMVFSVPFRHILQFSVVLNDLYYRIPSGCFFTWSYERNIKQWWSTILPISTKRI